MELAITFRYIALHCNINLLEMDGNYCSLLILQFYHMIILLITLVHCNNITPLTELKKQNF